MKLKINIIVGCLLFFGCWAAGQSKTQVKELGIKSTTVLEYDYTAGKETKKKVSYEKFNTHGQVIESIDYNKEGKQKERIEFQYNENGNVTEERYFDNKNKLTKTIKYSYKGYLKQTKEKYNNNNELVWKKVYNYEM
jgi:hypothetical protein